jgi:iduronate 2-sulfatase
LKVQPQIQVSQLLIALLVFVSVQSGWADTPERPNVLLLLVDDLKPALGCYGDAAAKTPCLNALAARGTRFDLAYCNQAVCAPSRFNLMLGSHSTSTGLYHLGSQLRGLLPDAVTLPQHFSKHGYRTESLGKVFHIGHGNEGDPQSFDVPHFADKVIEYLDLASTAGGQLTREEALFSNQKLGQISSLPRGAAFESPLANDTDYADGRVAAETIERLQQAQTRRQMSGTPFFIAAGFVRPHLPFSVPKKYWDLYDPAELPMPSFEQLPAGAPRIADKRGGEIAAYDPVPQSGEYSEELKRRLIHGYYASTSFVDAQVGKVLAEVDRLGLTNETIVLLWGDHGFHLGDHGIWTKHTNYEQAARIPLIIAAPGTSQPGSHTRQLAQTVDIFPTLAELCNLPAPQGPQAIDGMSLVPVLRDSNARLPRDHAYHVFPRPRALGRAIRTDRYRLVQWKGVDQPNHTEQYELYDYDADPLETVNLADAQPVIIEQLMTTLLNYPPPVDPSPSSSASR